MDNKKYWWARSYLYKLDPDNHKDLCHDAYISYWKGTGKNLFDESEGMITTVIKRTAFSFWKSNSWQHNKERQGSRQFVQFIGGDEDGTVDDEMIPHKFNPITPLDELVAQELLDKYYVLTETQRESRGHNTHIIRKILDMRIEGFNNKEIAEELGVTKSLVTYYVKESGLNKLR